MRWRVSQQQAGWRLDLAERDGGIKGEEMKSRLLQPLGWWWQLLIHQAARRGAHLNERMARRHFIELAPVVAAGHKEERLAHAEPRPPLTLGPRHSPETALGWPMDHDHPQVLHEV